MGISSCSIVSREQVLVHIGFVGPEGSSLASSLRRQIVDPYLSLKILRGLFFAVFASGGMHSISCSIGSRSRVTSIGGNQERFRALLLQNGDKRNIHFEPRLSHQMKPSCRTKKVARRDELGQSLRLDDRASITSRRAPPKEMVPEPVKTWPA
jgi:hypothetical protein